MNNIFKITRFLSRHKCYAWVEYEDFDSIHQSYGLITIYEASKTVCINHGWSAISVRYKEIRNIEISDKKQFLTKKARLF